MDSQATRSRLSDIRSKCVLRELSGADLDRYWVDTTAARDPNQSVRRAILDVLEDGRDRLLLLHGHGGSGKSTELAKLVTELDPKYFVVHFSMRDEIGTLLDVSAADIVLVMMERLAETARQRGTYLDESSLQSLLDYFATVTTAQTREKAQSLAAGAGATAGGPLTLLAQVLGFFASIKADMRYATSEIVEHSYTPRQRPADLVKYANLLVNSIRISLGKDARVLLIVEDLDKLDIATAHRVFINEINVLTGIDTDIIYTIPIFVMNSPDAGILRARFVDISLPMIKVSEPNGNRADGFDVVREIVTRRVGPDALAEDALELLIRKTGGVLQHVFEVLHNAALMTTASIPLSAEHIQYALQRKKNEFLAEITLPREPVTGLMDIEQLYARLVHYASEQARGAASPAIPDGTNQVLLRACALVEYNGKRWHGVHPLVMDILRETDRLP